LVKNIKRDVEFPVHGKKEGNFVTADLLIAKTRNFSPCSCRVIPVLKIFGSQYQGGEEHTSAASQRV